MTNRTPEKPNRSSKFGVFLFSVATVGEFFALAGWYLFHRGHRPIVDRFYDADRFVVPFLRNSPEALASVWEWAGGFLHVAHPLLAVTVLAVGFVVERAMVVVWLRLPALVFTPGGNLHSLKLVIGGVTVAEIIVWLVWIALAERNEPGFAALVLVAGIHLVHAYEVAVIKRRSLKFELAQPEVMLITALESAGGVWALSLAQRGMVLSPLLVIFGALLIEHLAQARGLTMEANAV